MNRIYQICRNILNFGIRAKYGIYYRVDRFMDWAYSSDTNYPSNSKNPKNEQEKRPNNQNLEDKFD